MEEIIKRIQQNDIDQEGPLCAYIYDLDKLRMHVENVVKTLPSSCKMFYAIKANSDPRILEVMSAYVHGFEVASIGEIQKVRAINPNIPIIFGGPGKTDNEIKGAIESDVYLIHVESIHELRRVELIGQLMNKAVPILLRVNLKGPLPSATLQMAGKPTQFGIDESRIEQGIKRATSSSFIEMKGFHLHCISNQLSVQSHLDLIDYYCNKAENWAKDYDFPLSFINVGGGIGVNYNELDQQFSWDQFTPSLKKQLENRKLRNTKIIFECGRYLSAFCGYYATEVLDIKENHGKTFVVVRGGTQHFRLPVSWQHNHPFSIIRLEKWRYPFERNELEDRQITVVGQLCTPKDVFATDVYIKNIRIGDIILFHYAGAYGWSISHHDFLSHPHPKKVYLDKAEMTLC